MTRNNGEKTIALTAFALTFASMMPLARAQHCSFARTAANYGLSEAGTVLQPRGADDNPDSPPRYVVKTLKTLGGTVATAQQINSGGVISGDANLTGDTIEHGVVWCDNGSIIDLGTLGGPSSAVGQVNEHGLILGVSETADIDPLGENWGTLLDCNVVTGTPCQGYQNITRAVIWQDGVISPLPTLGGNNAQDPFTTALNNKGEAVGFAETSTQDPNCIPPQVLDFEAVIWGPKQGEIRELPPLAGDSVGGAFGINEAGQVVGLTGPCGFPSLSLGLHPVLWQNGVATALPTLGGLMNNAALSINNRGQIVGTSDLPGDTATHAVMWRHGKITDLGTLPGDFFSFAYGINDRGQVIVQSCDVNFNCRAALWQKGVMTDLNTLVPSGSLYLLVAYHINNQGEITGTGFAPNTGDTPAFVAVPCDEQHADEQGCVDSTAAAITTLVQNPIRSKVSLPEKARKLLQQRFPLRSFGANGNAVEGVPQ